MGPEDRATSISSCAISTAATARATSCSRSLPRFGQRRTCSAIAELFSKKPWPDLGQPRAPKDVATRVGVPISSIGCTGCHLDQFQGDGTVPRLAGMSREYMAKQIDRFSQPRAWQQSWHDRPDAGDLTRRPCGADGISGRSLKRVAQCGVSRSRSAVSTVRSTARLPVLSLSAGSAPRASSKLAISAGRLRPQSSARYGRAHPDRRYARPRPAVMIRP